MKQIKLEVGKTYRSRECEEVKIVDFCEGIPFPYKGNKGKWYRANGRWANRESPFDLIEEVTILDANQKHNRMKQIKLEVGKTYVNRKGNEVKIVRKDNMDRYPCQGSDLEWYAKNGRFYLSKESEYDLIEEVTISAETK